MFSRDPALTLAPIPTPYPFRRPIPTPACLSARCLRPRRFIDRDTECLRLPAGELLQSYELDDLAPYNIVLRGFARGKGRAQLRCMRKKSKPDEPLYS
jgi:hypothetical protein